MKQWIAPLSLNMVSECDILSEKQKCLYVGLSQYTENGRKF